MEETTINNAPVAPENDPLILSQKVSQLKSQLNVWRLISIVLAGLMVAAVVVFFCVDVKIGIHDAENMEMSGVGSGYTMPGKIEGGKPAEEAPAQQQAKVVTETKIEYKCPPETQQEIDRLRQQVSTLEAKNKELMRALTQ